MDLQDLQTDPRAAVPPCRDLGEFEAGKQLPALVINQSDPTATARELADLIATHDDFLFNGYAPVRIAVEADELPRALEVTTEAVRVYAHTLCRPLKIRKGKLIAVPLSKDIAQLYLNGLEGVWGLKSFRGIATAPILRDDGNIRVAAGLDRKTGLWCHNIPDLTIRVNPSKDDARAALRSLRECFQTFPYADGARIIDSDSRVETTDFDKPIGLDESTFLVALLTAVCRQSLELAPGIMVRAPTFSGAGTGKGLAVKAMCIVASGARPSAFTSGHDIEEFDKRLTSALVEARPAVFLDNFNAKELKSDILASALTEYPAMVRPMGQTKMVPLHTRTLIAITGNAIEIAEDMARRLIVINFDARMEDPEARKFAPGFLEDVFNDRPKLLTAALTIWRWGRLTGLPPGKPLGGYEIWAQWCRDPLLALGCRDPINRIAEIKAADPRRRALTTLFRSVVGRPRRCSAEGYRPCQRNNKPHRRRLAEPTSDRNLPEQARQYAPRRIFPPAGQRRDQDPPDRLLQANSTRVSLHALHELHAFPPGSPRIFFLRVCIR